MEAVTLQAEVRETRGKGPARQLRMSGLIPAIFYGPGFEPVPLTVDPAPLRKLLGGEYGRNQLFELKYGDAEGLAVVKDLEVHPVSRELLHVDFYAAAEDRPIRTEVPFTTRGRALGVQKGGVIRKLFRELPIRAFPQDVPAKIELDVGPLDFGATVNAGDLPLPEGVEVTLPPRRSVLVIEAKEKQVEKEEETPAAEAGEAEGEEAAPAEG